MIRRGYQWVRHAVDPGSREGLLFQPSKGFLCSYHKHAVKKNHEPVYVLFCCKAGEPILKTLEYPSRHVLVISDVVTGRAKSILHSLVNRDVCKQHKSSYSMEEVVIELFESKMFMFDMMKQTYLRSIQFKIVDSKEEEKQIFDTYVRNMDKKVFPVLFDSDPVARYMNLKTGQLLKNESLSTTAGRYQSFRLVDSKLS